MYVITCPRHNLCQWKSSQISAVMVSHVCCESGVINECILILKKAQNASVVSHIIKPRSADHPVTPGARASAGMVLTKPSITQQRSKVVVVVVCSKFVLCCVHKCALSNLFKSRWLLLSNKVPKLLLLFCVTYHTSFQSQPIHGFLLACRRHIDSNKMAADLRTIFSIAFS